MPEITQPLKGRAWVQQGTSKHLLLTCCVPATDPSAGTEQCTSRPSPCPMEMTALLLTRVQALDTQSKVLFRTAVAKRPRSDALGKAVGSTGWQAGSWS